MTKKDKFSVWVLLLVLVAETFSILALRAAQPWFWCVTAVCMVAILIVWAIGNRGELDFKPKSVVASNLLANAIAPRAISAFYLLFFVIHIGWLTDGTLNLFLPDAYKQWDEIVISFLVGAIGLFFLIVFFPISSEKRKKTNIVFISGISLPSIPFIPKDKPQTDEYKYSKLNLRPLVRMLQIADDTNCQLHILKSDGLVDSEAMYKKLSDVYQLICKKDFDEGLLADMVGSETSKTIKMTELLIRECAKREFPQKDWIDNLKITWTKKACDYDNFNDCFKTLNADVLSMDDKDHSLYFNLTPGTASVGGVMTLLAMDPKRSLYYYRQKEDINIDDEKRLVPVEKDYESLKMVFSGALENIRGKESSSHVSSETQPI